MDDDLETTSDENGIANPFASLGGDYLPSGAVDDRIHELADAGILTQSQTWERIVRHFLAPFVDGDVWQMPFDELRERVIWVYGGGSDGVPTQEDELWEWFGENVLGFERLPAYEVERLTRRAHKDLSRIRTNLQRCEALAQEAGNGMPAEYARRSASYFKELNEKARDEVIDFLLDEIDSEALFRASRRTTLWGLWSVPYHFAVAAHWYDPDHVSDVRNKFKELPLADFPDVERMFKERPQEFATFADDFIADYEILERLRGMVSRHHRLARRRVLPQALNAYERRDFHLFNHIAPAQIEGVLHDLCREVEQREDALHNQALTAKVRHLANRSLLFCDAAYYAYRFPIRRNPAAHGDLWESDDPHFDARLLLLDLFDVCDRLVAAEVPTNRLVELLREAEDAPTFRHVAAEVFLADVVLPDEYNLAEVREQLRSARQTPDFWDYCDSLRGKSAQVEGLLLILAQRLVREEATRMQARALLGKLDHTQTVGLSDVPRVLSQLPLEQITQCAS